MRRRLRRLRPMLRCDGVGRTPWSFYRLLFLPTRFLASARFDGFRHAEPAAPLMAPTVAALAAKMAAVMRNVKIPPLWERRRCLRRRRLLRGILSMGSWELGPSFFIVPRPDGWRALRRTSFEVDDLFFSFDASPRPSSLRISPHCFCTRRDGFTCHQK